MTFPKPIRTKNRELLKRVAQQPCAACGRRPPSDGANDPHHVTTKGAFGGDIESNIMPLCREHHTEWDKIAPSRMIAKYFGIERWLVQFKRFDVLEKRRAP
jgi:hypothetical protein